MVHALYLNHPKGDEWFRAEQSKLIKTKMPIKFHYVYVLHSLKDGLFYIGYSEDLKNRVADHNKGKNVSTKNRRPLELIFYESFPSKTDALRRETYFKTTKGKTTLKQMLKEFLKNK